MQTANGLVSAETQVTLPIHKFGDFIQPYVLESTPDVISIGARCVDQGYAFHWPARSVYPYFVTPAKEKVFMVSIDNVPYLYDGKEDLSDVERYAAPAPMAQHAPTTAPKPAPGTPPNIAPATPPAAVPSTPSSTISLPYI